MGAYMQGIRFSQALQIAFSVGKGKNGRRFEVRQMITSVIAQLGFGCGSPCF
jgi:hypothetical protein